MRVAVVTGASRGIGRSVAERLAQDGHKVACLATKAENAANTVEAIKSAGGSALAIACDVGSGDSVASAFDQISAELGPIEILVNNAGVTADGLMLRMDEEQWARPIEVNLTGAYRCCRAAMRDMMKARWGRIVCVSSIVGLHGAAGQANYSASKAGLIGLTMSLAREIGSRGITCNAIAPGFIETGMTADLPDDFKAKSLEHTPLGRLGRPEDVAAAIGFLCSEEAGFITGQVITVDGGLTL